MTVTNSPVIPKRALAGRDDLCDYCGENPAEPGMACCDNSRCKARYVREVTERRA